jgi:hypothetical protein
MFMLRLRLINLQSPRFFPSGRPEAG